MWRDGRVEDLIKSLDAGVSVNSSSKSRASDVPKILKTSCVYSGRFNSNEVKDVADPREVGRLKESLAGDTIIISRMNTPDLVGANGYSASAVPGTFLPDRLWQAKPKPGQVHMRWLAYWFESTHTRFMLSKLATGTSGSMKNITKSDVLKLPILIPSLAEQKKIAEILSSWERAIEATERLLENSKHRKKALMQQLLTGKKRLPGFEGEWSSMKLGDLFSERKETNRQDLPLLTISGRNGLQRQEDSGRRDTSSENMKNYRRICPGDIGYNTMRMWQGRSCLANIEGVVSPAYTIATPKTNTSSRFFIHLFKTPECIHEFYRYSQGLVSDTWNLKYHNFCKVTIDAPNLAEQEAIATFLDAADELILKEEAKLRSLHLEKKALMQQLLTGKKRVAVDQQAA